MIKPLGRKAYGHIPHLPGSRVGPGDHKLNEGQTSILTERKRDKYDTVYVSEKLDGSCCAVAKLEGGTIVPLIKAGYHASTSRFKQHHLFARWVNRNFQRFSDLLQPGERVVGEWLVQAHGTLYKLPHEPFVAFDMMAGTERLCYQDMVCRLGLYSFIWPRLLFAGDAVPIINACNLLETSGHGAVDPVEGAVWRVERKGKVDFLGKWVRQDKIDGYYMDFEDSDFVVWNVGLPDWMEEAIR